MYQYEDVKIRRFTFDDIPLKEMEEAICDCCEAAGLKFDNFDDILRQL